MATESDTKVTNSPEYTAFQKCYESLIDTIAQECGGFCNSLFAKSFISTEIRDFTRLGPVTNKKKAEQLVDALADKIKHYPSIFHEFLKILKIQTPFADNLLEQLESLYEVANSSNKHSHSMHLDISQKVPSPEINKESFVFVCPHCRKCTLEEFICKRNCVKASEKNLFPYLDTPHLSLRDRHILEARLHSDTEKMVTLFAEIDTNIAGSLQANIPVLKNFILDLVSSYGHDNYVEKLEKAETIPEIFVALRPFKSFLNYQIVEKIVKKFGSKENQQDMQVYSNAFIDFCKRSAFEVPLNALSQCFGTNKMKVLSVKLVSKVEASLKDVVSSQQKIAAILGVNEWDLHIVSIEKGCVCLRFIVPAKFLFPLSQFQVNELDIMNIKANVVDSIQVIQLKESVEDRKQLQHLSEYSSKTQSSLNTILVAPQICVTPPDSSFERAATPHKSPLSKPGHLSLKKAYSGSSSELSSGYGSGTESPPSNPLDDFENLEIDSSTELI